MSNPGPGLPVRRRLLAAHLVPLRSVRRPVARKLILVSLTAARLVRLQLLAVPAEQLLLTMAVRLVVLALR